MKVSIGQLFFVVSTCISGNLIFQLLQNKPNFIETLSDSILQIAAVTIAWTLWNIDLKAKQP